MVYEGFEIKTSNGWNFTIHRVGSGALPKDLSGMYSTKDFAVRAIKQYKEQKVKPDASEISTSRG